MAVDVRTKETQDEIDDWSFDQLMLTNDVYDALDAAQKTANKQARETGRHGAA